MQTPNLPIQVNTAGPAPKNARAKNRATDDGGQFSQTLSREMDQHKSPMIAPPAPVLSKSAAPVKAPQQARPADKAPPAKTAVSEPSRKAPAKAERAEGAADEGAAQATQAAQAAQAAQVATAPMVDMLALVASFNQPAAAAVAVDVASADPLLAGGARQAAIETPVDATIAIPQAVKNVVTGQPMPVPVSPLASAGKDAIAKTADKSFTNMMSRAEGGMPTALKGALAEAGQDRELPLERATPQTGLERAAARSSDSTTATPDFKVLPELSQAGAARTRELTAEAPLPADVKVGALASAPLQQAALGVAQAANSAGAGDKISARVGTPAWDNQVAQKIVWMVAGEEQSASLTLNPPDLGPMQVVLSVTNDMASVTFTSAQPEVRQALEDAMPKLREMMSENGIALGNASVNDGAAGQQQADGQPARHGGGAQRTENGGTINGSASDAAAKAAARPVRAGEAPGLVDTFA